MPERTDEAPEGGDRRTIDDLIAELEADPRWQHDPGDPAETTLTFIQRPPADEPTEEETGDDGVQ